MPDSAAQAGGPPNLDKFVNRPLYISGNHVEDVDVVAARNPKRRKLIHQTSRFVAGRATTDQKMIVSLSNELDSAMRQLQEFNVALDVCQKSKVDIQQMHAHAAPILFDSNRNV